MTMLPIIDGHNDTLLLLASGQRDFCQPGDQGHFDLPRARRGHFAGGLFAIFTPPPGSSISTGKKRQRLAQPGSARLAPVSADHASLVCMHAIEALTRLEGQSAGQLRLTTTAAAFSRQMADGVISAVLHFEGAEAIRPDLANLEQYYRLGLRSLGLVWSRPNAFGHGVGFAFPGHPDTGPGLSAAGKALVRACNSLGICIDLSHLNEQGFWDVARTSSKPLVASHSAIHALCPSPRNLTKRQLTAIRESKGLVGINFCPAFIRTDGRMRRDTPLATLIDHFCYAVDAIGLDHVGFGSDFDGALLPRGLRGVEDFPKIITLLAQRGFDQAALAQLAHGNWLRVLAATLAE